MGPNRRILALGLAVGVLAACGSASSPSGEAPTTGPSPAATVAVEIGQEVPGSRPSGDLAFLGPLRQVPANGISIGVRQFGSGSPLVLIMGQDSPMAYWGPEVLRRLAEHYRVTIFDNRGVGSSTDQPDQPLTIELMGDDTAALIGALGLDHPAVFGWSTGGEIGLALAVRHPESVGPLMVSGATAGSPASVPASPALDALLSSPDPADQLKLLDTLFTPSGAGARQRYIDGLLSMPAEAVSPEIVGRQAEAEARFVTSTAVFDGLSSVTNPVLVTDGAEDQLVPVANVRLIAERIPGARSLLVADSAHAWMMQEPDRFVATVVAFTDGQPLP